MNFSIRVSNVIYISKTVRTIPILTICLTIGVLVQLVVATDPYDFGDYPHAVQLTFIDKDTREPVSNESGKLLTHVYCDEFVKSLTGIDCREMYIDEAFLTDENGQTTKYLMSSFETWVSIRNVSVGFHPIQDAYIIGLF